MSYTLGVALNIANFGVVLGWGGMVVMQAFALATVLFGVARMKMLG